MLLLRDVFYNDALFGLISHNHPCVCFRESRSSLNFKLSWVSQLFVVIQRQPRVWGLGGLGRGRLVVWNPRIPRESQNSKVTTGPQTIWVTIAPTKQKHPEFRIRSPEVDFFFCKIPLVEFFGILGFGGGWTQNVWTTHHSEWICWRAEPSCWQENFVGKCLHESPGVTFFDT